ncbi:MAG: WYL domain-containing protein [Geminicoccaceae bacterium]|nr:WYL domain-containing protein [Geminicoccaceae bacterium]
MPANGLPPLAFGEDEGDALILGLGFVAARGDPALVRAAGDALAKIAVVLPEETGDKVGTSGLLAGSGAPSPHLAVIRRAMRAEEGLRLGPTDERGASTERTVWPIALGFFGTAEVLAAWCETRDDFRHFRLGRIKAVEPSGRRHSKRRRILLAAWRLQEVSTGRADRC